MENTEWLKSLTEEQLADEIKYGKVLAEGGRHKKHHSRQLEEAKAEMARRKKDAD